MTQRLLLSLALWASCSPGNAGTAALSQPRVRCRASRYPVAVDCSWTPLGAPNSTRATSFIATYRLGVAAQQQSRPCLQPNPQATRCTIPHVHLFSTVPYVLNVTAVHPGGASSNLLAFVAERITSRRGQPVPRVFLRMDGHTMSIYLHSGTPLSPEEVWRDLEDTVLIKPDPPEGVRLRAAEQRLQVLWNPPASWPFPDIFSLKYRVRYRRHGASHFRQVGPIEATTFTLRTAQPHAKYFIQVSAQDLTDYGKPSDWSLPGQAERTPQNH